MGSVSFEHHGQIITLIKAPPTLYFNHAGCSFTSTPTLAAMIEQLKLEQTLGNAVADSMSAVDRRDLYKLVAWTVNSDAENIALTDGHTTGWTKALHTVTLSTGDLILTTRSEWGGNLRHLQHLARKYGCSVVLMPTAENGSVCLKDSPT